MAIFALAVLSVSFIYIGYTGFSENGSNLEQAIKEPIEIEWSQPVVGENIDVLIETANIDGPENFFAEFRMKRDRARASQIEVLKENINNPKSTQETINQAQELLVILSEKMAMEAHAENLLRAKDYENSAVFVEGENISVFVQKDKLSQGDITKIGDLVIRATGSKLEQIVITPKN